MNIFKRAIIFSISGLIPIISFEQVQNYSYTDCGGYSENVYDIIGAGKPLLIASTGLDCSICMGDAPDVKTFSEQHPEVRVWGAINNRYTTVQPTCLGSGANHFLHPAFYIRMIPPLFPAHEALNIISGAAEMLLGLLMLIPKTRKLAAWGLILLLIAVFPANIYMAFQGGLGLAGPIAAWVRLPFQFLFFAWVWWHTKD